MILPSRETLLALRTEIRRSEFAADWPDSWDSGGCNVVSEVLADTYGLAMDAGCFVIDGKHYAHVWNVTPAGAIFDLTCDTFGYDPFGTVPPNECYDRTCGCGRDG